MVISSDIFMSFIPFSASQILAFSAFLFLVYFFSSESIGIYLIDFSCYLPPANLRVPAAHFIEHIEIADIFVKETIDFQTKVYERSSIGPQSCLPLSVHQIPPDKSLNPSKAEVETVLFTVVKEILEKHKVNPKNIDILVSNCSIFCPTPSITSMIINKFGFRSNVKSISLSGMGCSAGLIAISLAKDLLKVNRNSLALVLSMEAITPSGYEGKFKSFLLANVLFRMGGVAVLLSNKSQDRKRSKYTIRHLCRTHMGSDDESYKSVCQETDGSGLVGVSLSRNLLLVAGNALKNNIRELAPHILPLNELILAGLSIVRSKLLARKTEIYVPDFKRSKIRHFCIHAGGKAVVDAVQDKLRLSYGDGEASRMTLYRFGNTSSSSVWYELSYLEAKGRINKGDRVWQIAFGSGFKCNSAIWECISELDPKLRNVWSDEINMYPVSIPEVADY
ncbi:3-ketoacyl-CoA synthase 7 [Dorcoceras hygrometricum]|uniref:3-ketoacyl-CoA synthase n=1 Tax=Dorcoceras hygrometricum TaxID=472368 RepID=A0A2Z7ALY9_9LAMI|nr:3-ketoacyl-CoA synthase 7 [Dorcoceras hygrometricum]